MSEETTKKPESKTAANKAAAPVTLPKKRTITVTFGEKEAAVYDKIVKDAADKDRTEAKYLAIWLRENYQTS